MHFNFIPSWCSLGVSHKETIFPLLSFISGLFLWICSTKKFAASLTLIPSLALVSNLKKSESCQISIKSIKMKYEKVYPAIKPFFLQYLSKNSLSKGSWSKSHLKDVTRFRKRIWWNVFTIYLICKQNNGNRSCFITQIGVKICFPLRYSLKTIFFSDIIDNESSNSFFIIDLSENISLKNELKESLFLLFTYSCHMSKSFITSNIPKL